MKSAKQQVKKLIAEKMNNRKKRISVALGIRI